MCITNDTYSVEIDPNRLSDDAKDDYLFCVRNKIGANDNVIMGVNTDGNGYFNGKIIADSGRIGGFTIDDFSLSSYGDTGSIEFRNYLSDGDCPGLFSMGFSSDSFGWSKYANVSDGAVILGKTRNGSIIPRMKIYCQNEYTRISFLDEDSIETGYIGETYGRLYIKTLNNAHTRIDGKTLVDPVITRKVNLSEMTLAGNWDGYNTGNQIPSVDGYTAISAFPYASNAADVCWMSCYLENGVVNAGLKNTVGTQKTFTPSVTVLYVKNF